MSPIAYAPLVWVPLVWVLLGGTSAFIHLFASDAFRNRLWVLYGWDRIIRVFRVVCIGAVAGPFAFAYMLAVLVEQWRAR